MQHNIIKNRKTGASYHSDGNGRLNKLPGLFTEKRQTVDASLINEFIKTIISLIPDSISDEYKRIIRHNLQKACADQYTKISSLVQDGNKLDQFLADTHARMRENMAQEPEDSSIAVMLKSFGKSMTPAMISALSPAAGAAMLGMQITAAAAQATGFTTSLGIPPGGHDLCSDATNNALAQCIQGYINQLGESWAPTLPQFARVFEAAQNGTTPCINANELQQMMLSAFGNGPLGPTSNCTLSSAVLGGNNVSVSATQFDDLACKLLKNGKNGFDSAVSQCNTVPSGASNAWIYGVAIGGGAAALITLGIILCCCCRRGCCKKNNYTAIV